MTVIGTINVPAGTKRRSYETAAWYQTFEHPAQTCEVHSNGNVHGFVTYTIVGLNTYNHFPSLFGGVATGGGSIGEINEPATFGVQIYNYEAAALVESGLLDLDEDVAGVEVSYHDHPVSCSGYTTDYSVAVGDPGERYVGCDHEAHENGHGVLVDERNSRGHLKFGYAPGVKDRKRHAKIAVR